MNPLGFPRDTAITVQGNPKPLSAISVGDHVDATTEAGERTSLRVVGLRTNPADHIVTLHVEGTTVSCAPGTLVWEPGDDMFRAAGSLSPFAEVQHHTHGDTSLEDLREHPHEGSVHHLILEDETASFWAGGLRVKSSPQPGSPTP